MSNLQPMYCRHCEQTLLTDSRERCDSCGSTDVVPAVSREDDLARLVAEKKAEPTIPPAQGVFGTVGQIVDAATLAPDVGGLSDAEARRHTKYHHRIVIAGCLCGVLGLTLGISSAAAALAGGKPVRLGGLLAAPVLFGAGGFMFGMGVTCLAAPTAFLTGPVGRPWMDMIGTRNPVVARIACAIFGLMVTVPLLAIGILVARSR